MSSESTEQPVEASDAEDRQSPEPKGGRSGVQLAMGPMYGLLFALIGGGLAWATLEAVYPFYKLPDKYDFPLGPPPSMVAEVNAAQREVDLENRVVVCGLLGVFLGVLLGAGEGVARRSLKTALLAALGCGLVMALLGSAAGATVHMVHLSQTAGGPRLSLSSCVIVQCALWAPIGAALGLTLGALSFRVRTVLGCLLAGLAAGALVGVIYPVAASFLMPALQTDMPVPREAALRLLWIGCPMVLLGLIIPLAASQSDPDQGS